MTIEIIIWFSIWFIIMAVMLHDRELERKQREIEGRPTEEEEYAKFVRKKEELSKIGESPLYIVAKPSTIWDIISVSFIVNLFVGSMLLGCFVSLKMFLKYMDLIQ